MDSYEDMIHSFKELYENNWNFMYFYITNYIDRYQCWTKIYIDEYPEQQELREKWLERWDHRNFWNEDLISGDQNKFISNRFNKVK